MPRQLLTAIATLSRSTAIVIAGALSATAQSLPAFSGADGAAANVTGGRGGIVYHVTKLDKNYSDNGPGTLRYGLTDGNFTTGGGVQKRTIVFDVAGTFWLGRYGAENGHDNGWDTNSRYNLGSNVTVAGQTAPGPVTIMGGLVKAGGSNAILRNVTIAPGYGMRSFSKPEDGVFPTPGDFPDSYVYDAIDITGNNLMIDHVTTVYATDETISANEAAHDVTIQYSNISQGQNYPQADAESSGISYTGHALGSLLQAGSDAKMSVHHNLYAHQKGRLPRVGSEVGTGAYNDFRNNVFYNWLGTGGSGAGSQPSFNNFVNNFWLAGPGGDNPVGGSSTAITTAAGGTTPFSGSSSTATRVYHSGNVRDITKDGDANDGVALTNSNFGSSNFQPAPLWHHGDVTYDGVTDSATAAYARVLDYMGANWWTRDNVVDTLDERIIHEVRTGTGKIKAWADDPFNSDPNEGVEWRNLLALRADPVSGAAPYAHPANWDVENNGPGAATGDGMPSWWEMKHGLDPMALDHNGDFDGDGYTNLEEYVNELAEWPAPAPTVFSGATNNRFAQITNWDVNADPEATSLWQPSKYDVAQVNSGTAVVDSAGQHAGTLVIAANSGDDAQVNVTGGWLEVQDSVVIGGTSTAQGALTLSGGLLRTPLLSKGAQGAFAFTGGALSADVVSFSLVNQGGVIAPGSGVGETHVLGDLTMQAGSIAIAIGGTTSSGFGRIVVDGQLAAGGELEVSLQGGFLPTAGDAFDLMDFSTMTGAFTLDLPPLAAGLQWDATLLASDGVLGVAAAPLATADFNHDGMVDQLDLATWSGGFGSAGQVGNASGDADLDGDVDGSDFLAWQRQLGDAPPAAAVPEPATAFLAIAVAFAAFSTRRI
jgi:hypothetical protein